MMEGKIEFGAQHTPTWETYKTVTLSVTVREVGGLGAVALHKDVSVTEARAFAAQIEEACLIVERDRASS